MADQNEDGAPKSAPGEGGPPLSSRERLDHMLQAVGPTGAEMIIGVGSVVAAIATLLIALRAVRDSVRQLWPKPAEKEVKGATSTSVPNGNPFMKKAKDARDPSAPPPAYDAPIE